MNTIPETPQEFDQAALLVNQYLDSAAKYTWQVAARSTVHPPVNTPCIVASAQSSSPEVPDYNSRALGFCKFMDGENVWFVIRDGKSNLTRMREVAFFMRLMKKQHLVHPDKLLVSTLGQRINESRIRTGWTIAELGRHVGRTAASISSLESGDSNDTVGCLVFPLADALGVSARWLMTGQAAMSQSEQPPAVTYPKDIQEIATHLLGRDATYRGALRKLIE